MTELMGVLNITPDSFSDGGAHERVDPRERTEHALAAAQRMLASGATIIDVGGESTRPGAERVPQPEEAARVLPVVEELLDAGVTVSLDTMYARTAAAALDLPGADRLFINDVSGGRADAAMLPLVAERGAEYILSHWRGHSVVMNSLASYTDASAEILAELTQMRDTAVAAGIAPERIVLDAGLGFAKDAPDNWAVLGHLDRFQALGHRLLVGASRKRFLGELLPEGAPAQARDLPTAIVTALCAAAGVWGVRVHNVAASRVALSVADAWQTGARA